MGECRPRLQARHTPRPPPREARRGSATPRIRSLAPRASTQSTPLQTPRLFGGEGFERHFTSLFTLDDLHQAHRPNKARIFKRARGGTCPSQRTCPPRRPPSSPDTRASTGQKSCIKKGKLNIFATQKKHAIFRQILRFF